jgi:uncharacterized protein YlxW (UPF0749 family)
MHWCPKTLGKNENVSDLYRMKHHRSRLHHIMQLQYNYDHLLEKYQLLQKELLEIQNFYKKTHSEHINTVHFLQQKTVALNKTIGKKNKQLSGLLLLSSDRSSSSSSSESSDDEEGSGGKDPVFETLDINPSPP